MQIHRRFSLGPGHPGCALTIGNFDGVHRGHQAMLALLVNEARHRGAPSCVLSFEPHPRDFCAARAAGQVRRRIPDWYQQLLAPWHRLAVALRRANRARLARRQRRPLA
jgi:FAD synthase